jgi:hypothetical protein
MDRLCALLPFVMLSNAYAACHAARPSNEVEQNITVEDHKYTGLAGEWAGSRHHLTNRPSDQGKGDLEQRQNAAPQYRSETVLAETNQLDDVDRYDELEQ